MKETLPNNILLCKQWLKRGKISVKYWWFGSGNLTLGNWGVDTYVLLYGPEHTFSCMTTLRNVHSLISFIYFTNTECLLRTRCSCRCKRDISEQPLP